MRILNDEECERSSAELEMEMNVKEQRDGKKKKEKEAKGVKDENTKMKSRKVSSYLEQCSSNFLRPRSGKFLFYKTRARS